MQNYQAQERLYDNEVEQEINFREYIGILKKRKAILLTLLIVVVAITVITTFSATPIYTASTEVIVERNRGTGLENQYYSYEPEFLETQSAIIQSTKVAKRVVSGLKLATAYRSYFLENKKETTSFFTPIKTTISDFLKSVLTPLIEGKKSEKDQEAEGRKESEPLSDEDIIAGIIQGGLTVKPVKNTKIVNISFSHKQPAMAKMVADAVTKAYMDELLDMKLTTSRYALEWMTAKAQDERKKLEASEMAMQNYMRANDLVTVENKLAISPQKLADFSTQLSKAQTERKALEDVFKQISAAGNNVVQLENLPIFAGNEVLKRLRESIFKARQNISELSKKYGEKHPLMIKANDELGELLGQQKAEVNRVIASTKNSYELAKSQEKNLEELLATTKSELLNLNEKFIQYSIMKRDVDANRVVYESLTSNIKKEGITEQSQSINVWVIRNATLPSAPSKPDKKRNLLLGLLLGLISGVGCAFLVEYLDNTVKSEKDLENRYGLTVLGAIEKIKNKGKNIESFIVQNPLSPIAESYRLIRTGLLLSSADHPPKTMLVTSMGPGDGKTSTTVNLARVFSQGGKKVLIIDCDLRKPRIHTIFSMPNDNGLSNYLTGNISESIIHKVAGEELYIITSGTIPPNPAELAGSKRLKLFVEKLAENFDFIFLDSPPVQSVTDSLALTQIVDGTVVVTRNGVTTYEMIESGLKKLKDVQCHFLGFVLNGLVKSSTIGSYYSGYSSYYASDSDK